SAVNKEKLIKFKDPPHDIFTIEFRELHFSKPTELTCISRSMIIFSLIWANASSTYCMVTGSSLVLVLVMARVARAMDELVPTENDEERKKLLHQMINDEESRVDQETENEVDLLPLPSLFMKGYFDLILDQKWDPNHLIMQTESARDNMNLITNGQPNIQFIGHNFNSI
ncbi:hypothetical protein Tco_1365398, partial [Tanacetum coccineum]